MNNPKGLILTIIIIAAPLIWFCIAVNHIEDKYSESGDFSFAQTELENLVNEQINNANLSGNTYSEQNNESGDSFGSKYGNPISKLIENAKINVTSANVYQEPDDTSSLVGAVYKDMTVTVQDYPNGWSNIKYGEGSGWIKSEYVTRPDEEGSTTSSSLTTAVGKKGTVNVATLNVRATAENGDVVDQLSENTEVNIIGSNEAESWYEIQYGTKTGWISAKYVTVKY